MLPQHHAVTSKKTKETVETFSQFGLYEITLLTCQILIKRSARQMYNASGKKRPKCLHYSVWEILQQKVHKTHITDLNQMKD